MWGHHSSKARPSLVKPPCNAFLETKNWRVAEPENWVGKLNIHTELGSCVGTEQRQLLHVIVVLKVLESKSSALTDVPFNSSKTTWRISTTSCWELKSRGAMWVEETLCLSAHRKLEGSIGTVDLSLIAMFSATDFSNGDNYVDSAEEVLQSKGITLSAWRMVLT